MQFTSAPVYCEGGTFDMGNDYGVGHERPLHRATVEPFFIDAHEIKVEDFAGVPGDCRPVVNVSWHEASAHCAARGGRLPTEAEWEWAAHQFAEDQGAINSGEAGDSWATRAPAGATAGPTTRVADLLGNVWEWTASDYGPYPGADWPATDEKVLRGGSFLCSPDRCMGHRPTARTSLPPDARADHVGFRCVYDSLPTTTSDATPPPRPNIFLVILDDLRPELGCYGSSLAKTPNLDRFAASAHLFEQALVGVPVCGASRASMFSGLRPTPERFLRHDSRIDEDVPEARHLPCLLAEAGYVTGSNGKILHHPYDGRDCWTRPVWKPATARYMDVIMPASAALGDSLGHGPAFEIAPNNAVYMDQRTLSKTVEDLRELAARPDTAPPFFLGMGIFKPHLPFTAHQMFWDLYDPAEIGLADNRYVPHDAPPEAMHNFGELRMYGNIPDKGPLPDDLQLQLRHGYLAALSFADAVFGLAMEELAKLGLDKNTVVIVMGDHGWQLGEHDLWAKHANFQTSLRTPLLVRLPGQTSPSRIPNLIETIDLFPTICGWAGITPPAGTAGTDLTPLLHGQPAPDRQAFSRFKNAETITTSTHSFTEFRDPTTGAVRAEMLYDLTADPAENKNVASDPGNAVIRATLQAALDSLRHSTGIPAPPSRNP